MTKQVILTGLRANNDLHLGNYLGALLPIVDLANSQAGKYQINLFVPDLHSFTTPIDHTKLYRQIIVSLKFFVAAGLDINNKDLFLYRQSFIPAHSELAWILNCFTGFGELTRMTEFKDKSARIGKDHIGVGQFDYPPLMAADILLYDALYVPVGDDQRQHLEFTRTIAERLNNKFGKLFTIPKSTSEQHVFFGNDQGVRVRDLQEPTKKMSKSDETGKGVIFLSDSPTLAKKKIMSATTDSLGRIAYNRAEQPGLTNLIDMLAQMTNKSVGDICKKYVGHAQYGPLKSELADAIAEFLSKFQSKLTKVDEKSLIRKLQVSEEAMNKQANLKLIKIQQAVGLRK